MNRQIPPGWHLVTVADVAEVQGGIQKQQSRRPIRNKYPFLRVANVGRGRLDLQEVHEVELFEGEFERLALQSGDLLVVEGNGSPDQIGRSAMWSGEITNCVHQNHLIRLRPKSSLIPRFLELLWNSPITAGQLRQVSNSTSGLHTLSTTKIKAINLAIPSLDEQRQIVAVLDRAELLREKRRKAVALLDDLVRSIFLDMFGDPDQSWPRATVENVARDTKGAIRTGPFGSQLLHDEFVDSGVSVLGIDNAVANEFQWRGRRFITEEKYKKLVRYTVYPDDVLITIMGTCGRCAIVPDDIPAAINTKHLCCITLDQSRCLPEFLHSHFLMHPDARRYLSQTTKGAIMDGLNTAIVKGLPITLPPIDLQQAFVDRIRAARAAKVTHTAHLAELDALFASLQRRAFRGELWVDSPAA